MRRLKLVGPILIALLLSAAMLLPTPEPGGTNAEQKHHSSSAVQRNPTNKPSPAFAKSNQKKTDLVAQRENNKDAHLNVSLSPVDITKDFWDYALIICTILLTAGLVYVGARQVNVASQSAEVARLALQVNRPFVLVTGLNLRERLYPDRPFRFIVEADVILKNFGTGPADIIDYIVETELFRIPPPDPDPDYDTMQANQLNNSLIAPNESDASMIHAVISLDDLEYESAQREEERVGIHGRIRYRGTGPDQVYWTRFFWWRFSNAPQLARANTKKLNDHS